MTRFLPAVLLLAGGVAYGQGAVPSASCTVTELVATNDKKGVDPKLDKLKAKLGKPPLSAFDTFTHLGEQTATVERQKPVTVKLVNGQLTLLFKDKLVEKEGKARLRIGIEHDGKDGTRVVSTVVSFDSGDNVLVGGKPYEAGTYFLALSCSSN
jgi:hypothetical protein